MVHPQRICAFTASKLCGNSSIELPNGETKKAPFFEVINDQNWNPTGLGYKRVSYVWGIEVNYIPIFEPESESESESADDPEIWNFKVRKGWGNSLELTIRTDNKNSSYSLRTGENFEKARVATRRFGLKHHIYLGVGFQKGETAWLDSYNSVPDDYLVQIVFDVKLSKGMRIGVSSLLENRLCGILGNMNSENDVEIPNSVNTNGLMDEFARLDIHQKMKFRFAKQDFSCEHPVSPKVCTDAENLAFRAVCEIIDQSPFSNCTEDKTGPIDNCVYDLCQEIPENEVICQMLSNYVDVCNTEGEVEKQIKNWRTVDLCPFNCRANQYFDGCGKPECQPTTTQCDVNAVSCSKSVACVEGCYCDEGYLMNEAGKCVETCDQRSSDLFITCDDYVYPHTIFHNGSWTLGGDHPSYPVSNGYDGVIDGDMVHKAGGVTARFNDFYLDVNPPSLTKYIKLWPRVNNACGADSYCKTVNNRDTSIFLNDGAVECTRGAFYNHNGMLTVIRAGESLIYNCPEDVVVYNLRISNNGYKNVHGAQQWQTWANLHFQEVQLAYPRDCDNFISKYDCRHPESHTLINPDELSRSYSTVLQNSQPGTGFARSMIDSAQSWAAAVNRAGEWMVMDLSEKTIVHALAIQGRSNINQWVDRYTVEYWMDGETEVDAQQVDAGAIFDVPERITENGRHNVIEFLDGIEARYVRITVQGWQGHLTMRAGAVQCHNQMHELL